MHCSNRAFTSSYCVFPYEVTNVVFPDPNISLWIATFATDAAAFNPNSIKLLLANGLSTFLIKGNLVFSNGPKNRLPKNPHYCPILCNWVFDNFMLANGLFAKALRSFETCVLVNKNLCRKLLQNHQQHSMKF